MYFSKAPERQSVIHAFQHSREPAISLCGLDISGYGKGGGLVVLVAGKATATRITFNPIVPGYIATARKCSDTIK